MKEQIKLSVIIVNYNTYHLTKQTIESVINKDYPFTYEIILVDNASSDGSIEDLKEHFKSKEFIHIIENTANLGFGKANKESMPKALISALSAVPW